MFEAWRSSIHKGVPVLFVKTVGAQAPIGFLSHQHTKASGALRMGHGDTGFLASTTCDPDPGRQVGRRAKAGHIDPRLNPSPLCPSLADSEDRVQQSLRPDTHARHLWVAWSHLALNGARQLGRLGRRLVGIQLHQAAIHLRA